MAPVPIPPVSRCRHSPCAQQLQRHHPRDTPFLLKHEQEETEASRRGRAGSCAPCHPQKPAVSPGRATEEQQQRVVSGHRSRSTGKGRGVPLPGHHLGGIFASPFLTLLVTKSSKPPQRSCGEGEMPESESSQAQHCSLQPVALVRPRRALHHRLQRGN